MVALALMASIHFHATARQAGKESNVKMVRKKIVVPYINMSPLMWLLDWQRFNSILMIILFLLH